ncbi:hypothetical protein H0H81_005947 [Sphagnurus paluster]|uniref:Uncharacterized protein n=1 Tax=Sphagnurus paluster TaxID=117069 RepID=A0A9P7K6S0_9AGAR|nr:hypothetical protein H0H81_005947 [Sphagnurus paluster]
MIGKKPVEQFLSVLPAAVCGRLSLPTWEADLALSEITTQESVSGRSVENATIVAIPPGTAVVPIGLKGRQTFNLIPSQFTLTIKPSRAEPDVYRIGLGMEAKLGDVMVKGELTRLPRGPFILTAVISAPLSLRKIFNALGLGDEPAKSLPVPLEGAGEPVPSTTEFRAGFSASQRYGSVQAPLCLDHITLGIKLDKEIWGRLLPKEMLPSEGASFAVKLVLLNPANKKQLRIGINVDYVLSFGHDYAQMRFKLAHMPILVTNPSNFSSFLSFPNKDYEYRTTLCLGVGEDDTLPAPPLSRFLEMISPETCTTVENNFPLLDKLLTSVTIRKALVEIGGKSGSRRITSFEISGRVDSLTLYSSPTIEVENAKLDLAYDGSEWSGSLITVLEFARKFLFEAELQLPTRQSAGLFKFSNGKARPMTFGDLVHEMGLSPDALRDIPVIGDGVAGVVVDHFSIQVKYVQEGGETKKTELEVSAFEVELYWEEGTIGVIKLSGSRLSLHLRILHYSTEDSMGQETGNVTVARQSEAPSSSTTSSQWSLLWNGTISPMYRLFVELNLLTTQDTKDSPVKQRVIGTGEIVTVIGEEDAGQLIQQLTNPSFLTDDPAAAPPAINLWKDTFPVEIRSSFELFHCKVSLDIGEQQIELLRDSKLAESIESHLTIEQAQLLVFRNASNVRLTETGSDIDRLVPWRVNSTVDAFKSDKKLEIGTGLVVVAQLQFAAAAEKSNSVVNRMVAISDSKYEGTDVQLICIVNTVAPTSATPRPASDTTESPPGVDIPEPEPAKASDPDFTMMFAASICQFPVLESIRMEDVSLGVYFFRYPETNQKARKYKQSLRLKGTCVVDFSASEEPWKFHGWLAVHQNRAQLGVEVIETEQKLSSLGNLTFREVKLQVDYIFAAHSNSPPPPSTPVLNPGRVAKKGSTTARYEIALTCKVRVGNSDADAAVVFLTGRPQVIAVDVPGTLDIEEMFHSILGDGFSADLLSLQLSELHFWYCWSEESVSVPRSLVSKHRAANDIVVYTQGFHANALAIIFGGAHESTLNGEQTQLGIEFLLAADITTGDASKKGFKVSGTPNNCVDLVILKLHKIDDKSKGLTLRYSTHEDNQRNTEGAFIEAGITILDTKIGYAELRYKKADAKEPNRWIGELTIEADILTKEKGTIAFELVEKNGKLDVLIEALKKNTAKFTEVMFILGVKKAGPQALKALARRNQPEQITEEEPEHHSDDGGDNGDGGGSGGLKGPSLAFFCDLGLGIGGILLTLFIAAEFIRWLLAKDSHSKNQIPEPSDPKPSPLGMPTNSFEKAVYAVFEKDFHRWKDCPNFPDALNTAHACALDYRDAIQTIRWVLDATKYSYDAATRKTWVTRLQWLIYEFNQISADFGKNWCQFHITPSLEVHESHIILTWDDDLEGRWLAVKVRDIELVISPEYSDKSITVRWRVPLTPEMLRQDIKAEMVLFATKTGGEPEYRFFTQGKRFTSNSAWSFVRSEMFGDPFTTSPNFDDVNDDACKSQGLFSWRQLKLALRQYSASSKKEKIQGIS